MNPTTLAWRNLPFWLKILLIPVIISSFATLVVMISYTLIGLLTALDGSLKTMNGRLRRYLRKSRGEVMRTA